MTSVFQFTFSGDCYASGDSAPVKKKARSSRPEVHNLTALLNLLEGIDLPDVTKIGDLSRHAEHLSLSLVTHVQERWPDDFEDIFDEILAGSTVPSRRKKVNTFGSHCLAAAILTLSQHWRIPTEDIVPTLKELPYCGIKKAIPKIPKRVKSWAVGGFTVPRESMIDLGGNEKLGDEVIMND